MNSFKIIVSGDFACWTRPELKVERVSYDVPTPSALIGLLKSIYWKPAISYEIDKIIQKLIEEDENQKNGSV